MIQSRFNDVNLKLYDVIANYSEFCLSIFSGKEGLDPKMIEHK